MTIRRSDGSFTFHFVNVVDDLEMQITHVIRGEDHLMNTTKHIQLYEAFEVSPPTFAHIPLILNDSGKKMSKRDEGASVKDYQEMGFFPNAMTNFVALLGWNPKNDEEFFNTEELIEKFNLDQINRAPARFDLKKALWMNQHYLSRLPSEKFLTEALPFLEKDGLPTEDKSVSEAVSAVQEKVSSFSEVAGMIRFLYKEEFPYDENALAKVSKNDAASTLLQALKEKWSVINNWGEAKEAIGETAKANNAKMGQIMFPTRVALSGLGGGMDLGIIISILGKEKCITRLERFLSKP